MRSASVSLVAAVLLTASIANAAKLAPNQNKLQPLPPDVQPAVSQSVERSASPTDLQTIQTVQASEQHASDSEQPQTSESPLPYIPGSSGSDSVALWVALVVAVLVVASMIWFWRSF